MELKSSRTSDSLYFSDGCLVREASSAAVPFEINESLKTSLINDKKSHNTTIKELLKINPKLNKTTFTIKAVVTVGDGEYQTINTTSKEGSGETSTI